LTCLKLTASMAERLTRVPDVREVESKIPCLWRWAPKTRYSFGLIRRV